MIGPLFLIAVGLFVVFWLLSRRRSLFRWHTINVNGLERRYLLRRSDEGARYKPLLLCFHGGRAQVELLARRSGVAEAGQRLGCLVIFPEAKDGWIDLQPERGLSPRDLDFVDALLDLLVSNKQIDSSRIFAFGISNGGQFVFPAGMRASAPFRRFCNSPFEFAHCRAVSPIRSAGSDRYGVRKTRSGHALGRRPFAAPSGTSSWWRGHVGTSNNSFLGRAQPCPNATAASAF